MTRRLAALLAAIVARDALLPQAAAAAGPKTKLSKEDRATVTGAPSPATRPRSAS